MVRVGASLYDVTTWWCISCSLIMAVPFCGWAFCECCSRMGGRRQDRLGQRLLRHRDDDLALDPPGVDVVQRRRGVGEVEDPVDDRADHAGVDQRGDLAQLLAAGAHEQERVPHPVL